MDCQWSWLTQSDVGSHCACGSAVFDDLHQGLKNLKFLADPTVGEIRIGGNESIIGGLLPAVFDRLRRQYPGIAIRVTSVATITQQYRELRELLILGRIELPSGLIRRSYFRNAPLWWQG
jgi:DNA-binding transcriptional LysR family regulator